MADALSIPIEIPGAEVAKIALDQIVDGFSKLEQKVIRAAEKGDATKDAFAKLREQFTTGAISAAQFREALAGIAGASVAVETAVRSTTQGTSRMGSVMGHVKDEVMQELGQKAAELGQSLGGVGGHLANIAANVTRSIGPAGIAIAAVGTALAFGVQAYREHAAAMELADAKTKELAESADRLGATYPSMTSAMASATTAAEAHTAALAEQQRILGQQIELMNRGFSGGAAREYTLRTQEIAGAVRELGGFLHGATEEQIRATIETGNEIAQRELLGVAFRHSTNEAEENERRMAAATVVHQRATEAVAAHKQELVASAEAALANARAEAEVAATVNDDGQAHASALRRVEEATRALEAAHRDAHVAQRAMTEGAREARVALDQLAAASDPTGFGGAMSRVQELRDQRSSALRFQQFVRGLQPRRAGGGGGARAEEDQKTEKTAQLALERELTAAYEAERQALARLREEERREADARDQRTRGVLDELTERLRAEEERAKAQSVTGARAAREESERTRSMTAHLEATATFRERMREMNLAVVDSSREMAEGVRGAFGAFGSAITSTLKDVIAGRASMADALQMIAADTLESISTQAWGKAGFYFAEGLGLLFTAPPLAGQAFAASAAFGAVAAATGAIAGAVRPDIGGGASGGGGGGASRERAAPVSPTNATASAGGATYVMNFGGPMYGTGGPRQAAREIVGVINRGNVHGGVQLLPSTLRHGGAGA